MTKWTGGSPKTFGELFLFYNSYVKLLYSSVQTSNTLPSETLFEINAAFDHLARHWYYNESEDQVVARSYSHLKRSCLDIFKIKVREARKQYEELSRIDTSVIDNGDFDRGMHQLFNKIRDGAVKARQMEGAPDQNGTIPAFEAWEIVFADCELFEKSFFMHPRLNWAKKVEIRTKIKDWGIGVLIGVIGSLLASAIYSWITAG